MIRLTAMFGGLGVISRAGSTGVQGTNDGTIFHLGQLEATQALFVVELATRMLGAPLGVTPRLLAHKARMVSWTAASYCHLV